MSRKLPVLAFALAFFFAAPLLAGPLKIAGRVQAAAGTAQGRAALFPARSAGEEARLRLAGKADPPLASARILPDGGFELEAPEFGLYRVLVHVEGHLPMELYAAVAGDTELPEVRPEPARPVEILVLDPEGRPAAGVPLSMASWAAGRSVWPTGRPSSWEPAELYGVTEKDGRLALSQSADPNRALSLRAPGIPRLDIAPRERSKTLRLPVRRPHRLVVRGSEGRPLAGVLARSDRLPLGIGDDQGRIDVLAVEGERIELEGLEGDWAWVELSNAGDGPQAVALEPLRIVKGRVLEAGSRSPLAGALVWMGGPPAAQTAADGTFAFAMRSGVHFGDLRLEGAAPGHVVRSASFREGQEPLLLLPPAAEIRGSVTGAGGEPVAGVEVSAIPADEQGDPDLRRNVKTRTAADGSFRLRGLVLGRTYRLGVQRAGLAPAVRLVDAGSAVPVHIALSPGARVSGRILDEAGRPVAGVRVVLTPTNEGDLDAWHAYQRRELRPSQATTDAEGRFQIAGVSAGSFHLRMDREGFLPESRSVEVPDPPRDVDLEEVTLEAEAFVEGLVTDEHGEPLAGARVYASLPDPGSVPAERWRQLLESGRSSQTGADGRFRLGNLIQGRSYTLSAELDGYVPAKIPDVEAPARAPLRIEMKPAPSLTGRVVGPDGRPVAMASVQARREGDAAHMPPVASASCDESGRFRLFFAAPGSVTLAAAASGYRTKVMSGVGVPASGEAGPVEISLEPGMLLEGRVLDEQGRPVAGARVSAWSTGASNPSGVSDVFSDANGRYRLEGLDLGPHTVSATAGDRKAQASVDIGLNVQSLDLRFEEQASVSGRVTDAAGAPVSGAGVFLISTDPEGERARRVTSGADGTFAFPPVSRGTYRLLVLAESFGVSPPEEVRVDRDLAGLDLRLFPGAVVSGLIRGLSPEELPAVRIVAVREGAETRTHPLPGTFLSGTVDRDGRYRILQLGTGKWHVIASLGPQRKAEGRVEIALPGEEVELDLGFGEEPEHPPGVETPG